MWFGRVFELTDGRIILPCEFCGNPAFEPDRHTCAGLDAAMADEMAQRVRDGWREA